MGGGRGEMMNRGARWFGPMRRVLECLSAGMLGLSSCGPVGAPEKPEIAETGRETGAMTSEGTDSVFELEPPDPCVALELEECESPCIPLWTVDEVEICLPVFFGCFGSSSECNSDEDCRSWQECMQVLMHPCPDGWCDACGGLGRPLCLPIEPPSAESTG
jgi:hypothetical protein